MRKSQVALKHLKKIQQLMSNVKSPYKGMGKQEIINEIRKPREKLWEAKFAAHS